MITEIKSGGQITVNMGRKVYYDPNNPYGIDLMVYGNSFFTAFGASGTVSDKTDLGIATLSTGIYGQPTESTSTNSGQLRFNPEGIVRE